MRLIQPHEIELTTSNVSESAYSEWDSGTTYATGDKVYVTLESDGTTARTPHKIYESLVDANSGSYPPDDSAAWLDCGASNRWKMFDRYVNSQTENADSITVTFAVDSYVDTLALFALFGREVNVICKATGVEVSNQTISLDATEISDWRNYYYGQFAVVSELVVDMPGLYQSLTVEVTISAPSETVKCGQMVVGLGESLGKTEYTPTISIADYSVKTTNDFGETRLTKRAFAKLLNATLNLPSGRLDIVAGRLAEVRSTPCVWEFNNLDTDYSSLIIYGYYKDFDVMLRSYVSSTCSLEIEGLI